MSQKTNILTESQRAWIVYWAMVAKAEYEQEVNLVSPSEYKTAKELVRLFSEPFEEDHEEEEEWLEGQALMEFYFGEEEEVDDYWEYW